MPTRRSCSGSFSFGRTGHWEQCFDVMSRTRRCSTLCMLVLLVSISFLSGSKTIKMNHQAKKKSCWRRFQRGSREVREGSGGFGRVRSAWTDDIRPYASPFLPSLIPSSPSFNFLPSSSSIFLHLPSSSCIFLHLSAYSCILLHPTASSCILLHIANSFCRRMLSGCKAYIANLCQCCLYLFLMSSGS